MMKISNPRTTRNLHNRLLMQLRLSGQVLQLLNLLAHRQRPLALIHYRRRRLNSTKPLLELSSTRPLAVPEICEPS